MIMDDRKKSLLSQETKLLIKRVGLPWVVMKGPTFGAMMISGQKAAHLALKALGQPNALDGTYVGNLHPELVLAAAADAAEIAEA